VTVWILMEELVRTLLALLQINSKYA